MNARQIRRWLCHCGEVHAKRPVRRPFWLVRRSMVANWDALVQGLSDEVLAEVRPQRVVRYVCPERGADRVSCVPPVPVAGGWQCSTCGQVYPEWAKAEGCCDVPF